VKWGYYVAYNIMFYCGCRKSEVYPLTWHDYKNGSISVTKGLVYKVKGEDYVISAPKTKGSIREIPAPKQLAKVLEEHYARCQRIYGFSDDFFICGGVVPLTDTMLEITKNKWAKGANVKQIRIHDFRHSHASLLINNGANIQVVAKRLGHSDIEMTLNTYSHMYKQKEDEAVALINSLE
jgi:integrase